MAAHAGALAPPLILPLPRRLLLHPRFPTQTTLSSLRSRGPRLAVARAASGDENGGGGPPAEGDENEPQGRPSLPSLSDLRLRELFAPEPANATAVVLTGALAWAGASLLLQLSLIFFSIFVAAIKYSFVAAILVFILIALL